MSLTDVRNFLNSSSRNAWVQVETMSVYVRKGIHMVNGEFVVLFDIATVEQEEAERGKGKFRKFLISLEGLLSTEEAIKGIFVENVLNERLAASLPYMGFIRLPGTDPACFVKLKELPTVTGWKDGLLQDYSRGLARWFASKPEARQEVREIFGEIK